MAANFVILMRSEQGRALVLEKCRAAGLDMVILERLIEAEVEQVGKRKKRGLWGTFDEIFAVLDGEEG